MKPGKASSEPTKPCPTTLYTQHSKPTHNAIMARHFWLQMHMSLGEGHQPLPSSLPKESGRMALAGRHLTNKCGLTETSTWKGGYRVRGARWPYPNLPQTIHTQLLTNQDGKTFATSADTLTTVSQQKNYS